MPGWLRSHPGRALILLAFAGGGWLAAMSRPDFMDRLEMPIFDHFQMLADTPEMREKIAVVLATEASMKRFGHWPWRRGVHAGLLDRLRGSAHIVFDVLFPEESDPAQDRLFAAAVAEAGNVTVAVHIAPDDRGGEPRLLLPYRELAESAKGFGVTNVKPEPDGVYRDANLFWIHRGEFLPSIPLAAWLAIRGEAPDIEETPKGYLVHMPTGRLHLNREGGFRVHHNRVFVPVYEYCDVYDGQVPPETFRDATVFVGVNTAGTNDFLPVGRGKILSGALYNAHAAQTLLHGWIPYPGPNWALWLATALLAAVGAAAGLRGKSWRDLAWVAMAVAAWVAASLWLFLEHRLWFPPVWPALACLVAYFLASLVHLRLLSAAWRVQSLSVDSHLFITSQDFDPERLPFARYLEDNWREIREWSGIDLLRPDADDGDAEVRDCLLKASETDERRSDRFGALATVLRERGGNRMLIRLPVFEDEVRRYTVLGWRGAKDQEILKSVAAIVISAASNHQAVRETRSKRELFLGVIRLVMGAVDAKDPFTAGHSERVAALARELAERMELSQKEIDEIYLSGLLHDVGKLGIPDAVLGKPGRLTDEEMDTMRSHPALGGKLLGEIVLPEIVMRGIVEHHERPDGGGYPLGLKREELSLAGRILKVADVYDALVSKRQYKEPFSASVAYEILTKGAGSEFDDEIVSLVLKHPFTDNRPEATKSARPPVATPA